MKHLFTKFLALTAVVVFSACSSDDETVTGSINLQVNTTSSTSKTLTRKAENDLIFNSGSIVIREVVFDGEVGTLSVSRTEEQIATIDYATGVVSPPVIVEVPAGDYTGVNLGIELQDDTAEPSVVIEGTYTTSSGEVLPIRFEFNSGEVFEANAASVTIAPGADLIGKITFDAVSWFSTVSPDALDNATLTDGTIVVSSTQNTAIFDIVADRLDVDTQAVFE